MANDNAHDVDRAWELMKKIGFAMLVSRDGKKLRARPMSAYLERENNAICFLTDARRHKDEEIARNPSINLSFADAGDQKYVSILRLCRMIALRSSNCSPRRQKHGGIRQMIRISAS
jgi:general stress protein 26